MKKVCIGLIALVLAGVALAGPANTNIAVWITGTSYVDESGNVVAPNFIGDMTFDDFTVINNAHVRTNVGVGGTLAVTGVATFVSTPVLKNGLTVGTNATVGGTLGVSGAAAVGGNLTVTGNVSAVNVVASGAITGATARITGATIVGGNANVAGTLTVTGAITGPVSAANLTAGTVASAIDGSAITNLTFGGAATATAVTCPSTLGTNILYFGAGGMFLSNVWEAAP